MKYKITVDRDCCIGCGSCVAICPENFEMDGEGKSRVKKSEVEELGCAQQAVDVCPSSCIKAEKVESL